MKNLARIILFSSALMVSASSKPNPPSEKIFIPPQQIQVDLKDWEWMSMRLTGQFHIDVKYSLSDGKELIAHYQAVSKTDKWYTMNRTGYDFANTDGSLLK